MSQQTRPIQADTYWNATGVRLTYGVRYRITVVPAVGEPLKDASFEATSIAGEDWKSLPHKTAELLRGKRKDDAKWFALIGTVDREHPWVIVDGAVITAPATGELVCYFNDVQVEVFYANNSGWVQLEVVEEPAAA